jgi:hypothetical protein
MESTSRTIDAETRTSSGAIGALISHKAWYRGGDSISADFGKMVKSTDRNDDPGVFVETRSPADVNTIASVLGTEVERMRLHMTCAVGIFWDAGAPSASAVVKV